MRTDDLQGAIWIPGDGKANPADLTHVAWPRARGNGGATAGGRRGGDRGAHGRQGPRQRRAHHAGRGAAARWLVNCGGQWARQFGRAGRRERAAVPGRALLHRHRPHRGRAPDAAGDARPRRLHLLQRGGWRPADGRLRTGGQALAAWTRSPASFQFQLLDEDWDQFEPLDDQRHPPHALPGDGARSRCCSTGPRASRPTATSSSAKRPSCAATTSAPASTRPASPTAAAPAN